MTTKSGKKSRHFYGWNVVVASFLTEFTYAEGHASTLGLFFRPFQAEFGWSRSALAAVQTISRWVEALVYPAIGPLVDRHGPEY